MPIVFNKNNHHNMIKSKRIGRIFIVSALYFCGLYANAQESCIDHWETVIYANDNWRYAIDSNFQDHNWQLTSYYDSLWNEGQGGIGYGDDDDFTTVPNCKILFLRKKFTLQDTALICKALLSIDYDDGFVAWLNGAEIARSGVVDELPDSNSLVYSHEAGLSENFFISKDSLEKYFNPGENLLSIQIHNTSNNSSDLSSVIYFSLAVSSSDTLYGAFADEIILPLSDTTSFDIPLICIETNGSTIIDGPKITADMKIIHNGNGINNHFSDSGNVYTGKIAIKTRGSSSSGFLQKSYRLETRDSFGENLNVSLLNMPTENDWLLISNYRDRSFVRNFLSHEIFRGMGHYSPRSQLCEVVINGQYKGVYLLMEKIKRDKYRVDIAKLTQDENSGDDVTGGYIIKNDNYDNYGIDSWSCFFPEIEEIGWGPVEAVLVYEYPDWDDITEQQKSYIQDFIEESTDVLYGEDFTDPINGYYSYFNVRSFIDYFLVSEVSRNGDAYKKSRFFYKDKESKGGLLNAGPPWDFDWAWKNLFFQPRDGSGWVHEYEGYGFPQPVRYMNRMLQDPYFANETYNRYFILRQTVLNQDTLSYKIDSIANYISDAQLRHFKIYDILSGGNDPDINNPGSYENEIAYLKDWIMERLIWMDNNMIKFRVEGNSSNIKNELPLVFCRVFPNPTSDFMYIECNKAINKIEVMNTEGNVLIADVIGEQQSWTINVQSLNSGLYFLRINVQNSIYIRKIIKN